MPETIKKTFTKYEDSGRIALLVSPEYGAGWSTWATDEDKEAMLFDSNIVELLLSDRRDDALKLAEERYEESYLGGFKDLKVVWLDKGTNFYIQEYDGAESIREVDSSGFYEA